MVNENKTKGSWKTARGEGRVGTGNWQAWSEGLEPIFEVAKDWEKQLEGVERPWLCWNLDDDWCILQQKLVKSVGWTPIVGNDTNIATPTILEGSIYINFNETLRLPTMWMHFPLEFAFLFCERLAFWHSDLLCSEKDMFSYAKLFQELKQGELAAVMHTNGYWGFKDRDKNHYGELLGCTTREASRSQFDNGCGWWRHINQHPNFNKMVHGNKEYYYEHGIGITVWKQKFSGKVKKIKVNEKDGHASARKHKRSEKLTKSEELKTHFDLAEITKTLGIDHLL